MRPTYRPSLCKLRASLPRFAITVTVALQAARAEENLTEQQRMQREDQHAVDYGPGLAGDDEGTGGPAAGSAAAGRAAPGSASKLARGGLHANVEISANTTVNVKYLYYYTTSEHRYVPLSPALTLHAFFLRMRRRQTLLRRRSHTHV